MPKLAANKVNRSSMCLIPSNYKIIKGKYNEKFAKFSDRFLPHIVNI